MSLGTFLTNLLGVNHSIPFELIRAWILKRSSNCVLSGPFKGMWTDNSHVGSPSLPRALGTYELELHETISSLLSENIDVFVDVGAAEGYYAVGFALRSKVAKVIAFEAEVSGHKALREAAERNGVSEKLEVAGYCDHTTLSLALDKSGRTLVMVDIEGAEGDLLDPNIVPALRQVSIIVELHPQYTADVRSRILKAFRETHELCEVVSQPRSVCDYPVRLPWLLRGVLRKWAVMAIDERGYETWKRMGLVMSWLVLRPKNLNEH